MHTALLITGAAAYIAAGITTARLLFRWQPYNPHKDDIITPLIYVAGWPIIALIATAIGIAALITWTASGTNPFKAKNTLN